MVATGHLRRLGRFRLSLGLNRRSLTQLFEPTLCRDTCDNIRVRPDIGLADFDRFSRHDSYGDTAYKQTLSRIIRLACRLSRGG